MKRGFTLMEILIAMAILVVVIGSTMAIFRASTASWKKGEVRAQRYQQARFILERLDKEVSSAAPVSSGGPYFVGTNDKIYFVCPLVDSPASLTELSYWLNESSQELMRSYQTSPDYDYTTFDDEEVLSENISAVNFEYFSGELWEQKWDSQSGGEQEGLLPKAIKLNFDIQDEKGSGLESFNTVIAIASAAD